MGWDLVASSAYRSPATEGFSRVAVQRGLYRSIDDETLAPAEHLG